MERQMTSSGFTERPPVLGAASLPEIISALTFALDLTEGAAPGHALRCCLIGMRLANEIQLPHELLTPLYYALQLKDVGCSSNAARTAEIVGGDDRAAKALARLTGYEPQVRTMRRLWRNVLPQAALLRRATRILSLGMQQEKNHREIVDLRSGRGSNIVRKLLVGDLSAEAVFHLDEHWDGSGLPAGLKGREIPVIARITSIAQSLEVLAREHGVEQSLVVLRRRAGTWFDPEMVRAAVKLHTQGELWRHCRPEYPVDETRAAVVGMVPGDATALEGAQIDLICSAFADVVDAKSPFTFRHSMGVAEIAEAMAVEMRLPQPRVELVRRAALLHDLGKLRVPNSILDKTTRLTASEWALIAEHPLLTRSILQRVRAFKEMATVAGEHHEKLDGTGYPYGLSESQMSTESRIVAMADRFGAMIEDRPYRAGMRVEQAIDAINEFAPVRMDAACFEALQSVSFRWNSVRPAALALAEAKPIAPPPMESLRMALLRG
jgi:putative nucleotidyltransferase with HDIG domain